MDHNLKCGIGNNGTQAGGSGIGIGVGATGESGVITGNTVVGPNNGTARFGIFLETQTSAPLDLLTGYTVSDNEVSNYPVCFGNGGASDTIWANNRAYHCGVGISVDSGTFTAGAPGGYSTFIGNSVLSSTTHAIQVTAAGSNGTKAEGFLRFAHNRLKDNAGDAFHLVSSASTVLPSISIINNEISGQGTAMITTAGVGGFSQLLVRDNFGFTIAAGAMHLPTAAAGNSGWTVVITDGADGQDCTTGSGTAAVVCKSNGTVWAAQ